LKYFLLSISLLIGSLSLNAQSLLKDSVMNAVLLQVQYSYQFPLADMQTRFGNNSALGAGIAFKIKKNFILGIEGAGMLGETVKEPNVLKGATDNAGNIIGSDGGLVEYQLHERGFILKAIIGKIISFKKPNVNSGILINVGVGMMQHRIKIEIDEELAPQLNNSYQKGYDRLSNGVVISQFIGYQFMGTHRKLNFYAGMEFNEGFLKGRRNWNYPLNSADDATRTDVLIGLKACWMVPIYKHVTEKYYYN
jgi:hypothetical protein